MKEPRHSIEDARTQQARRRYDLVATFYDLWEWPLEWLAFRHWRQRLWVQAQGPRVLEVGVGTGKNFPYYPPQAQVTAIDFSSRMLERASRRAARDKVAVDLRLMDAQALGFPDSAFDTVVASFVFCSVPDPLLGLREVGRVCRPGGQVLLLEHVRSEGWLGRVMDFGNPLAVRASGASINRRTVENVRRAGLTVVRVENLWRDIVKLLEAQPGQGKGNGQGV